MTIYRGKGKIGDPDFEMEEYQGLYLSSCGNYFKSEPWTEEEEKQLREQSRRLNWKNRIKKFINQK